MGEEGSELAEDVAGTLEELAAESPEELCEWGGPAPPATVDPWGCRVPREPAAGEAATRVYKVDGVDVTVSTMARPGRRGQMAARSGRHPTTTGLDQILVRALSSRDVAMFAPDSEKERLDQGCWAGGLAYCLSTRLRAYLGDAIVYNDPPERK